MKFYHISYANKATESICLSIIGNKISVSRASVPCLSLVDMFISTGRSVTKTNKIPYVPSEDQDKPRRMRSLIRVSLGA